MMTDEHFDEARSAKVGELELPAVLESVRRWISDRYQVHALHVRHDTVELGPCEGRPRLTITVETDVESRGLSRDRFSIDPGFEEAVARQLARAAEAAGMTGTFPAEDLLVIVRSFADEALRRASQRFLERDAATLVAARAGDDVRQIRGCDRWLVVFYARAADVHRHAEDGVSERIRREMYEGVKAHDEFGYLVFEEFEPTFDSEERLNREFGGNPYLYFK